MLPHFEGETADVVWRQVANALLTGNDFVIQRGRNGETRELLHCTLHIRDPRQRWVLSRQPAMNPAFAIAEIVWILRGRNDSGFLNYWNPALPRFAGDGPVYHGAYGHRLTANFGFDQIERAYKALRADGDTRQVVLQIWDPVRDMPDENGSPNSKDIPCNLVSMLKIRGGRLEWLQVMRSNDVYRGAPHNFIQFTTLQEVMAGWLGIEVGNYIHVSDSLHLYERNIGEMSISPYPLEAPNSDRLNCSWDEFMVVLGVISSAFDQLRCDLLTPSRFESLVTQTDIPEGWLNFLKIAAADAARRRGWNDEMDLASSGCTNQALKVAWQRWLSRTKDAMKITD